MSLAPSVLPAPGDDQHPHHSQTSSTLQTSSQCQGSEEGHGAPTEAEATVPRALALNHDAETPRDLPTSSVGGSLPSFGVNSVTVSTPGAGAAQGTVSPTVASASSSTLMSARPTGRVVLQALDVKGRGANLDAGLRSSFRTGTGNASGVRESFCKDDPNRKTYSDNVRSLSPSSPLPPTTAAVGPPPSAADSRGLPAGSEDEPPPSGIKGAIRGTVGTAEVSSEKTPDDAGDTEYTIDRNRSLGAPFQPSVSPLGEAAPDESAQPREGKLGENGRSAEVNPQPNASNSRSTMVNLGSRLSSIPSFFQRVGGKAGYARASDSDSDFGASADNVDSCRKTGRWSVLSSAHSYNTEDYDDCLVDEEENFAVYDSERAKRNWRVVRAVFLALGIFRVGGLSRLRAKQLSAAEVKRGLRRNVTGGGQNIIPTMSFYAPKVAGDGEASAARYETLCSQWARFSPAIVHRMLRQKLLEHGTSAQEFTCERFSTTLLFADISGFTRLSARLNAEQLKTHTNQYFTMLIDVVARYGGDIIKFCGDAVMIIWPSESSAPRGVLQANAMQGAACALAMLNECGEYDVGKGEEAVALRLHCGMGSGQMYGYLVGAEDRWEYLVAGDPLRQIGEAEPEATQGEVILSPEAWELASSDFVATKTPQGNWLLKELRETASFSRPSSPTRGEVAGERNRRLRTSSSEHHINHPPQSAGAAADGGSGSGGGNVGGGSVDSGGGGGMGGGKYSMRHRGGGGVSPTHGSLNGLVGEKSSTSSSTVKKAGDPLATTTPGSGGGAAGGVPPRVGSGGGGRSCAVVSGRAAKKDRVGRMESLNNTLGVFRRERDRTVMNHSRGNASNNTSHGNVGNDEDEHDGDEATVTISTTISNDLHHHQSSNNHSNTSSSNPRRGSSSSSPIVSAGLPRSRTVTKNINNSSAVPEELRVQASEYLASYIKAQYDGGVETSMRGLSTALRGFTQESARHAIQSDTVKYLAEIRFVTTIFINIYGLEEQLKRGGGFLLQQTMDLGVSSLLKFGGVLRQFVVDDKGCVMIGAFGLPQYSYEDNEVRAISASKEIILAFQGLQLAASIGITTGQVYCGFVGASKRCEYAMMGCSVNLSARLMASAPKNTIQVDFEVWNRAHNFFDFETLTPIKAKGYVDPVPVFRPLGQALKDDHSKRISDAGDPGSELMVGVEADLEVLQNSARRLQAAGTTRPVILLGQSGSGKTRLVRSAQLRRIWRDATKARRHSRPSIEKGQRTQEDASEQIGGADKGHKGDDATAGAPVIITVCRNVNANTPYCIWNSILDKIFKLKTRANAQVSFSGADGPEHGRAEPSIRESSEDDAGASRADVDDASPIQAPPSDVWAENTKYGDLVSEASGAGESSIASLATSHLLSPAHGGGITPDGIRSPTRGDAAVGYLPPLAASPPAESAKATTATAADGATGGTIKDLRIASQSLLQRHTTLGLGAEPLFNSPALPRKTAVGIPSPNASPRSLRSPFSAGSPRTGTEGRADEERGGGGLRARPGAGGAAEAKPASLLKQQSESCLRQPRIDPLKRQSHQGVGAGGGRRTFVMPSILHGVGGQGLNRKDERSVEGQNEGAAAASASATPSKHGDGSENKGAIQGAMARVSMRESGGGVGGERMVAKRRPQRYDKIKMKSPVTAKKNKGSILNRAKTPPNQSGNSNNSHSTGANNKSIEDNLSASQTIPVGSPPQALKVKLLTRGAIGAVSVAQRVVSGFRGEPDWTSGSARSARKRTSSRWNVSGNEDPSCSRRNSKRHLLGSVRTAQGAVGQGVEKSRRETASKRSFIRRGSARMPERTCRDGNDARDSVRERESSDRSGALMAPMLTAEDLKGITSVEMEMEGMETIADPVSAVGEAAAILEWMRRSCPDMVPMAPLLQELLFAGFSETRMTASFPPDVRHRNLERLVVEVVRTAIDKEGKRLLLIVEDAQWMNQLSMKMLLKLAKAGLRLMIVISARPFEEYFETVPHDFTSFREIGTTIEMSPLSPSDCLVLARHVIGDDVMAAHPEAELLPDGSDVVLHEKSGGGNPLFVRNIAITLRDNLLTSGTVTPLVDLPAGFFHALIVSRFDALEPPEQTVLKAGTVIGATFSKGLLLHMLPNNSRDRTENLHAALLKLIEANFISRSVVGRTEHFSFVHNSVQETVYKMMLTDQKESLHEVCAEWHEKHNKGNANYQSVITHHWMRSSNTPKKVECHLMAAKKAQEVFQHEAVIQHMLALLAIAFGKDMATATVISLEPFLEATQPSLTKQVAAAATPPPPPPPPPPPLPPPRKTRGSDASLSKGGGTGGVKYQQETPTAMPAGMTATAEAASSVRKKSAGLPGGDRAGTVTTSGQQGLGLCAWFVDGMGSTRLSRKRRRFSSMVVPVAAPLTGKEAEAAERLDAARTAARLGCSVGNLTKRQREMLVAKDQEWLWAADFLPCLEFSDPMFTPTMVARWIGAIGMAHLHLGRLLPAHNHMQEALVYLRFPAVPSQALPLDRIACLAKECCLLRGPARGAEDILFAARLYGSIADISIKTGMGGNLAFINRLEKVITRGLDFLYSTHEGVRFIVNLANEELAKGHHDKVDMLLERAIALSMDIGDPITRGIALIASGTYNAGDGLVTEAEEDFAQAFEMFAPAGDYSRCGQVVVESAYVKLCSGDTPEALSMFNEVQDTAVAHKDDFLSQASLHGAALVHAITGNMEEASAGLAQMRCIVEEDWARRRGRRGRTAAATEGTSHASLVVMETLDAYLAASRGDGKAAVKGVCRASLRLSRPGALRFSTGLFLHLATDACFTILEQDLLPPGPEPHRRILAAARLLVKTLGRFAQVFDLMSPLHQLGRSRWGLLHGMDKVAEKALDLGLIVCEEDVHFPYAEGLLLLHSTRLESLPMDERRARARRGRRTLHRIGACLIPPADVNHNVEKEGQEMGGSGGKGGEGATTEKPCEKAAAA